MDLVEVKNKEVFTNSILLAKKFEKKHKYVFHRIEKAYNDLIKLTEEDNLKISDFMFQKVKKYYRNQEYLVFELNYKSFLFACSLFNCERAIKWNIGLTNCIASRLSEIEIKEYFNNKDLSFNKKETYVYLIKEKFSGVSKIGVSIDPEERLRQLQSCNQTELELFGYWVGGYKEEKELHEIYKNYRLRSEWFNFNMSDCEAVCLYMNSKARFNKLCK
jgi:hypothetical protein